jgi:hypothetical protein
MENECAWRTGRWRIPAGRAQVISEFSTDVFGPVTGILRYWFPLDLENSQGQYKLTPIQHSTVRVDFEIIISKRPAVLPQHLSVDDCRTRHHKFISIMNAQGQQIYQLVIPARGVFTRHESLTRSVEVARPLHLLSTPSSRWTHYHDTLPPSATVPFRIFAPASPLSHLWSYTTTTWTRPSAPVQ